MPDGPNDLRPALTRGALRPNVSPRLRWVRHSICAAAGIRSDFRSGITLQNLVWPAESPRAYWKPRAALCSSGALPLRTSPGHYWLGPTAVMSSLESSPCCRGGEGRQGGPRCPASQPGLACWHPRCSGLRLTTALRHVSPPLASSFWSSLWTHAFLSAFVGCVSSLSSPSLPLRVHHHPGFVILTLPYRPVILLAICCSRCLGS